MSEVWQRIRLGDVLRRSSQVVALQPDSEYREITVKLWGRGVVLRRTVTGTQMSNGSRFVASEGQLIYSRIDARNGALGIVPAELDEAVVTNEFPLFTIDTVRLDSDFLGWLIKTHAFVDLCRAASEGTTNRVRLPEDRFLRIGIPLPPIDEQRRIVARIEQLATQIEEARALREMATRETQMLRQGFFDLTTDTDAKRQPLGVLLDQPLMNGLSLPASSIGNGICFARVGAVNSGTFDPLETKLANIRLPADSPYWLRPGDVLISRGNTPELVGRAAVYIGSPECCAMPDLLIRCRVRSHLMDSHFLAGFFHSREARDYIASQISGTSSTMPKVSQGKLEALKVPVPPLAEQRRIVAELDALQAQVDELKRLQAETTAELDALLPAILDRAFKGEL